MVVSKLLPAYIRYPGDIAVNNDTKKSVAFPFELLNRPLCCTLWKPILRCTYTVVAAETRLLAR